jgi:esterase/lipase superfamily enzyme
MELSQNAIYVLLAGVALFLYAIAWWLTRRKGLLTRIIVRSALALMMLLPLAVGLQLGQMGSPDKSAAPEGRVEQEVGGADDQERPAAEWQTHGREFGTAPEDLARSRRIGSPKRSAAPKDGAPAARDPAGSPLSDDGERPFAESAPPAPTTDSGAPARRSAEAPPAAGATPPPEESDWDVVPVFYGTDRAKLSGGKRVDYGAERGKRLQLGHALVTVPKSHQVPEIERPWVYHIPFTKIVIWQEEEDPKKHFTIKEIRELGSLEFLELVRKRLAESVAYKDHALVFVHGFNTSFEFAVFRTAQMAYDLKFDGAPFVYSWPSKGALGVQDYSYDRESAGAAEPYFREFLDLVVRETGAKSVSVIAHSMGNQLLLPVLRDMRRSAPEGVKISQVILAAPDVDRDSFEFLAREIQGISGGVTLFAAANDRALAASRQFWGGVPRAGDVPPEGPIIVPGVDTIDVTAINTEMFSLNHSGYAEKTELLNDIRLLIQTGERPPERRIPILERVTTSAGAFWRYPAMR